MDQTLLRYPLLDARDQADAPPHEQWSQQVVDH